jgi:hypothetical protein
MLTDERRGGWGTWLSKNFDMHASTARLYMRWARMHGQNEAPGLDFEEPSSLRQLRGSTDRDREHRQSSQHQAFRRVLRDVARDDLR